MKQENNLLLLYNYETHLIWNNLNATIKDKIIVNNSSGYCQAGSILSIMGPSGAGKTTLLSMLACKIGKPITTTGFVKANNSIFTAQQFYDFGVFIYQNDILYQNLTVKETLNFAALMRYKNLNNVDKKVNKLIKQFELEKCYDTLIGGKIIKGISGGQKKRLSIAIEMVNQPSIIILDQPTSGLDSYKACRILKVLKKLSQQGKTIILTIHQPSYLVFQMLDRLILLSKGFTVYQGSAKTIMNYMQSIGIHVPRNMNISDFFMFELSKIKQQNKKQTELNQQNYNNNLYNEIQNKIQQISNKTQQGFNQLQIILSFITMLYFLFQRQIILYKRNSMKMTKSIISSILSSLIIGIIFFNTINNNDNNQFNNNNLINIIKFFLQVQNVCFIVITNIIMNNIFSVALIFPIERQIYYKETISKKYSSQAYFITKIIVQSFNACLSSLLFSCIIYWMLGFTRTFQKFITFCTIISLYIGVTIIVMALIGNSIGLMSGSLFKDASKASSLTPALILPMMMFSGLYNKLDSIPKWIGWLQYISPFRYGLHALLLNQFQNYIYYDQFNNQYNYQNQLNINFNFYSNLLIGLSLAIFYYILAFIFLKKLSSKLNT